MVRANVRAGRWRRYGRHVVALHRGPLDTDGRRWVALLEVGQRSALAGLSSAEAYGLTGFESAQIHVVVAHGARKRSLPQVVVHQSRRFDPERDVRPGHAMSMVRFERSVIDAASWSPRPRTACAILAAAVRQRLTTAPRLCAELGCMGPIRSRRLIHAFLEDIAGGSHAVSEVDFLRICRREGLPLPNRQSVRGDGHGRRRYLDGEFTLPDGSLLGVEIDGSVHLEESVAWDDMIRQNDIVLGGTRMLRFPAVVLRVSPEIFTRQMRAAGVESVRPRRRGSV